MHLIYNKGVLDTGKKLNMSLFPLSTFAEARMSNTRSGSSSSTIAKFDAKSNGVAMGKSAGAAMLSRGMGIAEMD